MTPVRAAVRMGVPVVVDADAISLVCDTPSIVRWELQQSSFIVVVICAACIYIHTLFAHPILYSSKTAVVTIFRGAQSVCITPNKAEMIRLARALLPVEQQQQQQRADTSPFDLVRRVAAALDGPVVVQKVTWPSATSPSRSSSPCRS